jgi:hypothetical protein
LSSLGLRGKRALLNANVQPSSAAGQDAKLVEIDALVDGIVAHGQRLQKIQNPFDGITDEQLDRLEARMLQLPQIEAGISHTFTPKTYVREGTMRAGGIYLGHYHKERHVCVVLTGRMLLLNRDRTTTEIIAPCVFMGEPGRKLVYIQEDVLMQNIHETEKWPKELFEDVAKMEEHLYAKTDAWRAANALKSDSKKEIA